MRFRTTFPHFHAYVLERVPGAIANLSTCSESGPALPNHSPRMLVNESALATGIACTSWWRRASSSGGGERPEGPRVPGTREEGPARNLCRSCAVM